MTHALLDQFVTEARDLVVQSCDALGALERTPDDAELVHAAVSAVRTLNGASGLFEIAPLTRLVHESEDLLAMAHSARLELTPEIVNLLRASLDQVASWLGDLEIEGALPEDASEKAAPQIAALAAFAAGAQAAPGDGGGGDPETKSGPGSAPAWLGHIPEADRLAALATRLDTGAPVHAIRYAPDTQAFADGEDPLHRVGKVPHRLLTRARAAAPWPAAAELDPFVCNLIFEILTTADYETLTTLFRDVAHQTDIVAVAEEDWIRPAGDLADAAACATFAADVAPLLAKAAPDWDDVREATDAFLARTPDAAREATLLRGLRVALSADTIPPWAGALVTAIGEGCPLNWAAPRAPSEASAAGPVDLLAAAPADDGDTAPASDRGDASPHDAQHGPVGNTHTGADQDAPLRIDEAHIDRMTALIDELAAAKNALPALARRAGKAHGWSDMSHALKEHHGVVDRIVRELQEAVTAVRMRPVGHILRPVPRMVRDLSATLGKEVEVVLSGEETLADRTVLDSLADPLLHIVRNAVVHGIEPAEVRVAAGKPDVGTIHISAVQAGDDIVIEIGDDGAGIDTDRVRMTCAVESGLIDGTPAADLSEEDAAALVFAAGVTTADRTAERAGSDLAAVRRAIVEAGGTTSLSSERGEGTRIRLSLPMTRRPATTRVMTVECAGNLYGVPMDLVCETLRIPTNGLHKVANRDIALWRDAVVPIVRLADRMALRPPLPAEGDEPVMMVAVGTEGIGLAVDAFRGPANLVITPLDGVLADVPGSIGTALTDEGRVCIVLDVKEFA
ncbi:CheA signal transduction histidine kinase [Stappia sp. 22II-S9-Z10]|nr:CheA signal transduction histidine kinase [Stappia sp. 22II-S9-Z10]